MIARHLGMLGEREIDDGAEFNTLGCHVLASAIHEPFNPLRQYGDYVTTSCHIDDDILAEAKSCLQQGMESIIPQELRHLVSWVIHQPVSTDYDVLLFEGAVAWKYTPARLLPSALAGN